MKGHYTSLLVSTLVVIALCTRPKTTEQEQNAVELAQERSRVESPTVQQDQCAGIQDTGALWAMNDASERAEILKERLMSTCGTINLLGLTDNQKKKFDEGVPYRVSKVKTKKGQTTLTVNNGDPSIENNLNVNQWMQKWVFDKELDNLRSQCVAPLAFSCVKNPDIDGKPVTAMSLLTEGRFNDVVTPESCNRFRNRGSSDRTLMFMQVKGADGTCSEFNVYERNGKSVRLVKMLSWMDKKTNNAFAASGCEPEAWSSHPQQCMLNVFKSWQAGGTCTGNDSRCSDQSQTDCGTSGDGEADCKWQNFGNQFAQLRNAVCGNNGDEYVPCWLGPANEFNGSSDASGFFGAVRAWIMSMEST